MKIILLSLFMYISTLILLGNNQVEFMSLNFKVGNPNVTKQRSEDIGKFDSLDILFLGSSRTYGGMDTRIFKENNFVAFNFGTMSQTPIQTNYLYRRYTDNIDISLVVIEVSLDHISVDGIEPTLNIISSTEVNYDLVKMGIDTRNFKVFNSMVFRMFQTVTRHQMKSPILGSYIKGSGYSPNTQINSNPRKEFTKRIHEVNNKQVLALKDLIAFLKNRGTKFVLVQIPVSKTYYDSFANKNESDSIFNSLGPYLNYSNAIEFDDSLDFADYQHLNQNGVNKFNKFLIKDLKAILAD
jgi:hypothetical protein